MEARYKRKLNPSNKQNASYTLDLFAEPEEAKTYFLYDSGLPVIELSATGAVAAVNTFGTNGLVSRWRSATNSIFYAFDERGVTTQRLDGSGTIYTSRMADAVGVPGGTVATTDPYDGFGGQWGYYRDTETGLVLCTLRYYDTAAGRWLTRDPVGYAGGINVYAMTQNKFTMSRDPSGLAGLWVTPFPHVYIRFDQPCDGNITYGFYMGDWTGGMIVGDDGSLGGDGNTGKTPGKDWRRSANPDPNFEKCLCDAIRRSKQNPPWYIVPVYMCNNWAWDIWTEASYCAYNRMANWGDPWRQWLHSWF